MLTIIKIGETGAKQKPRGSPPSSESTILRCKEKVRPSYQQPGSDGDS